MIVAFFLHFHSCGRFQVSIALDRVPANFLAQPSTNSILCQTPNPNMQLWNKIILWTFNFFLSLFFCAFFLQSVLEWPQQPRLYHYAWFLVAVFVQEQIKLKRITRKKEAKTKTREINNNIVGEMESPPFRRTHSRLLRWKRDVKTRKKSIK